MTEEDFKNQYIDKDDYEFIRQIDNKNIVLFKIILYTLLAMLLVATYIIINRVFLVPKQEQEPKLLFVVYILIVSLFYFFYLEFTVRLTNFIVNNSYPI